MLTYADIVKQAHQTYLKSCNVSQLAATVSQLKYVLGGTPNEENKQAAEMFFYRIEAKRLSILYFDQGYGEEEYAALHAFLSEAAEKLVGETYQKTATLIKTLNEVTETVHSVMLDAAERIYQVRDENGEATTASPDLLSQTLELFSKKREVLEQMPETNSIFSLPAGAMFDIKTQALADISEICDWTKECLDRLSGEETESFFAEAITSLADEPGDNSFAFYPALPDRSLVSAKTMVICSPLRDEVVLFLRAFARERGGEFSVLRTASFANKSEAFVEAVFAALDENGADCVLFDAADYYDENKESLLEAAIRYSLKGHAVFFVDNKGDRGVYDALYAIAKSKPGLSGMDVSYKYMTLPTFSEVTTELEERGVITPADYDTLRRYMAFMGYVGLNRIVSLFAQSKPWRDAVIDISEQHEILSRPYLLHIPSQTQFMDAAWRDLGLVRDTEKKEKNFDYDQIRRANPANVKRILEGGGTLFAKCGLITRYCLLCGDDISAWAQISLAEKNNRVNDATRLVAHLLDAQYEPEVEIIEKAKWEHGNAGGVCCDGGKRIYYREDCCGDYSWLVDAICHECYHAFQHTLVNSGWLPWHRDELMVSPHRPTTWGANFGEYKNKPHNVYMNQVVESDARIFAEDCFQQSDAAYHTIDLE